MNEIILEVLEEIACSNTSNCQINLQSLGARKMIAHRLEEKLQPYFSSLVEDIVCGVDKNFLTNSDEA